MSYPARCSTSLGFDVSAESPAVGMDIRYRSQCHWLDRERKLKAALVSLKSCIWTQEYLVIEVVFMGLACRRCFKVDFKVGFLPAKNP